MALIDTIHLTDSSFFISGADSDIESVAEGHEDCTLTNCDLIPDIHILQVFLLSLQRRRHTIYLYLFIFSFFHDDFSELRRQRFYLLLKKVILVLQQ